MQGETRDNKPKPEANAKQTGTMYTVQQLRVLSDLQGAEERKVEAWVDLGTYTALNNRKAVEDAMADHGLEEGDFRPIPETSAKVFKPRVEKRTTWT
jgi:hypothetical protein